MIEKFDRIWGDFLEFRALNTQELHFQDQHSKFVLAYWARVNSLCSEIMTLVHNQCYTSAPIIMRSALESLVDLRCLITDSTYMEQVLLAQRDSEFKHMKQYSESNPFYSKTKPLDNESLSKLKPAKRSLGIADRFKKANCEELYSTVYNQLCRYTHGNITALASKHFENDSIVLASSISDAELSFIISSTINTAIISTHDLLEFYEVDDAYLKDCLGLSTQVKAVSEKFV